MQFCDVIFCNRYYAWYHDYGQTQLISKQLERELRDWFDTHSKAVVQAEYGADTVAGMHVVRAHNFSGFTSLCCMIGKENSHQPFNQSNTNLKLVTTWLLAFSRASGSVLGCT